MLVSLIFKADGIVTMSNQTQMDFYDFRDSKKVLLIDDERLHFEDEDGVLIKVQEDNCIDFHGQDIYFSDDCEWLIIYENCFFIERLKTGEFILAIENQIYESFDLMKLEKILYDWSR